VLGKSSQWLSNLFVKLTFSEKMPLRQQEVNEVFAAVATAESACKEIPIAFEENRFNQQILARVIFIH
jgi:hypothetical protein